MLTFSHIRWLLTIVILPSLVPSIPNISTKGGSSSSVLQIHGHGFAQLTLLHSLPTKLTWGWKR